MIRRYQSLLVAAHLLAVFASTLDKAESSELKGGSQELGFTFAAQGQNAWCDDVVRVDALASNNASFSDRAKVDRRLWRLLQIAQSRCDKMRRLEFRVFQGGKVTLRADFPSMVGWKTVEKDVDSGLPKCPIDLAPTRCKAEASAYKLFERLSDGHYFSDAKLTSYMTDDGPNLAWSSKIVHGTVTAVDTNSLPTSSTAAFNAAIAQNAATTCLKSGGSVLQPEHERKGDSSALASFVCQTGSVQVPYTFITIDTDMYRWLVFVGSPTGNVGAVHNWAKYMLAND
ncbi:hypothetical protein [Mesorhizobium sp. CO1-1-4]|uniref:hypothetical protein n=1 Tax=Mesorhizobium sp. CO1-1-4 TaxID=2876633 RepID=UPI001CCAB382|nr:hypothetical protein [Mesorhizobium sp. CO1-1-4]MBZ9740614.1 hypothetical protein [Mesorhizobium sp. CO1-1-4]